MSENTKKEITLSDRIAALIYVVLISFFFFILPFGYFIPNLFWLNDKLPVTLVQEKDKNYSTVQIDKTSLSTYTFENTIVRAFRATLDLTSYKLCFENTTQVTENGKTRDLPVQVNFFKNNGDVPYSSLLLARNEKSCKIFNIEETTSINTRTSFSLESFPTKGKININVLPKESYAFVTPGDKLVSSFVFLLAYWGLILAIKSILTPLLKYLFLFFS